GRRPILEGRGGSHRPGDRSGGRRPPLSAVGPGVEYGVATRALPAAEVLPAAMELARDIAVNAAPVPVAISKQLLWEGVGIDLAEWRAREGKLFRATTRLPDAREGT